MTAASLPPAEAVARPAGFVAGATLCSRVLGLAREAVFAALFATSQLADAFVFAFRIPNLLRDFFAEGALSAAFVPTLSKVRSAEGDAVARGFFQRMLGTVLAVTGAIALLGILFAPAVVSVVAFDAPTATQALTVTLTRIMFPFLPLVAAAAVIMGVLNTYGRYFVPALAPAFFNVVAVLGGLGLLLLGVSPTDAIVGWAVLVLVGGATQLVVQLPVLGRLGFMGRPTLDLRLTDPALRTVVRRMGPVVLGLAGTNIMLLVTTALASREEGWASVLNYAFRLVHLPIGLIGVALGTVVLSAGARRFALGDASGLAEVVRRGLSLNLFLALPAAVGLFVLAPPIVQLVYERGAFGGQNTERVALALRAYALGIVFYSGVKAAAPAYLARGDTRTPMLCSLLGLGVNLVFALGFIGSLGLVALAGAVSLGAATNFIALRWVARHRGLGPGVQVGQALRISVATAGMGLAVAAASRWLSGDAAGWAQGAGTLGLVLAAGALYLLLCRLLGVAEARGLGLPWAGRRGG